MANGKPTPSWFLKKVTGPDKWCDRCRRRHPARGECGFHEVTRIAKSGKRVKRYALPTEHVKSTKKSKARQS